MRASPRRASTTTWSGAARGDGGRAARDRRASSSNFIGYCLGGTLLASTLGYLARSTTNRVKSATYFVSRSTSSEPGELGVFIDEQTVTNLDAP